MWTIYTLLRHFRGGSLPLDRPRLTLASAMRRIVVRIGIVVLIYLFKSQAYAALDVAVNPSLATHSTEFRQELIKVREGVYSAVGYGLANIIFIEGENGVIVVDSGGSMESAQKALKDFRKLSQKPIKALIYTHSHPDHIGGGLVFAPAGSGVPVYAHAEVQASYSEQLSELEATLARRAQYMYGSHLTEADRPNLGIGKALDMGQNSHTMVAAPTKTLDKPLSIVIAGVKLELVPAPGETDDQIFVWLPEHKVLLPGDNIYRSFPNLYTIRGTTYRDPKAWVSSLDAMRKLNAHYMVPSHGRPLTGVNEVSSVLRDYRDAIRYVYDQTIRMINKGLDPQTIASSIQLPPHLAKSAWLKEYYGKVSWSAMSIYYGQLGWFDGNTSFLTPMPKQLEAEKMLKLAGGEAALNSQIASALRSGDFAWVLRLSDIALTTNPANKQAKDARVKSLKALAASELNANARNYYLTEVLALNGDLKISEKISPPRPESTDAIPISSVFAGMATHLKAELALEMNQTVSFEFTDLQETWTITVRRGSSEVFKGLAKNADIHVKTTSKKLKELVSGISNPVFAIVSDFSFEKGGRVEFTNFMLMFDNK